MNTKDILLKYWDGSCPIQADIIAKNIGLSIIYNNNEIKLRNNILISEQIGRYFNISNIKYFTKELLLPEEFINHFIFSQKITNIKRLSIILNVPTIFFKTRLKDLKLI